MMETTILGISVALQLASAVLALTVIRVTGKRLAWILLASAIALMALRRSFTLFYVLGGAEHRADLGTELIALAVSALMLGAVALMHPLIRTLGRAQSTQKENRDLLARLQAANNSLRRQVQEGERVEQELRDAQRKISTLMSNLPGMVYRCQNNADWTMDFVSQGCRELTGYAPEDFLNNAVVLGKLIEPAHRQSVWEDVQAAVHTGQHFEVSYPIVTALGEKRWVWDRGVGIVNEEGELLALEGFITDITDRKHAEGRIQALARFPEEDPNLVMRVSDDGKLVYANPAARRLFGHRWSRPNQWLPSEMVDGVSQAAQSAALVQQELSYADRTFILAYAPIDGTGYVNIYGTDITERKQAEEALRASEAQLRQAQKLEAVGRLAGGVAHDFNNVITIINGYCELLAADLGPDDPRHDLIDVIKDAGTRAGGLTRQLLAFSRKQVVAPKVFNLNDVVIETKRMLQQLIGEDIQLCMLLNSDIDQIKADPGQIEQVIMNLAINARDAMPQGGQLTIETRNAELDNSYADSHWDVKPGRYVVMAISDNGCGMDAETQAHIFEPFFTTKAEGKGTGLGLSTVFGIVKQNGGHIFVYSEAGCGTTFKIYLPEENTSTTPKTRHSCHSPIVSGSETVLLVEDQPALRNLAKRVLQWSGYTVLEAGSGDEALQLASQEVGPIHLLLTDVVMGGMSGRQLAERLGEPRPETKVLYMSGYTDDAVVQHGVLHAEVAFLQKPFTPSELTAKVRSVLDNTDKANPSCMPCPSYRAKT